MITTHNRNPDIVLKAVTVSSNAQHTVSFSARMYVHHVGLMKWLRAFTLPLYLSTFYSIHDTTEAR